MEREVMKVVKKTAKKKAVAAKKKAVSSKKPNSTRTKSSRSSRARAKTIVEAASVDIKPIEKKTKFRRLTAADKEKIIAVYCFKENKTETARVLGLNRETVSRYVDESLHSGELFEMRKSCRDQYVNKAWGVIDLCMQTIEDGLKKGYVAELKDENGDIVEVVSRVTPGEASRVIRDMHHTSQIEDGEPTSIVKTLAESYETDEELLAEIDRLNGVIAESSGSMN